MDHRMIIVPLGEKAMVILRVITRTSEIHRCPRYARHPQALGPIDARRKSCGHRASVGIASTHKLHIQWNLPGTGDRHPTGTAACAPLALHTAAGWPKELRPIA